MLLKISQNESRITFSNSISGPYISGFCHIHSKITRVILSVNSYTRVTVNGVFRNEFIARAEKARYNFFITEKGNAIMEKSNIFENLVMNFSIDSEELPGLSKADERKLKSAPTRLKILAEGLAGKWDLEQVNQNLEENGCEKLYARSFYEACLIYAFERQMGYDEWRELFTEGRKIFENADGVQKSFFKGGKITLKELKEYMEAESFSEELQTMLLTRSLEEKIIQSDSKEEFWAFVQENIEKFSSVRERARYYFCKYLYFYIQDRCDRYYESCIKEEKLRNQYGNILEKNERGREEKFALEELAFLKPLTKLKKDADKQKNNMSLEEKKEYLENTALTPGGIFDEFNYFYFGYVSVDWMEILFELYGNFDQWPQNMKIRVAHSLGLCSQNPSPQEWKTALQKLTIMEEEQRKKEEAKDFSGSREEKERKKAYQRGRGGEDFFREFITGGRDINRATLISFLLFVKVRVPLDDENKITMNRLNRILTNCGFAGLKPDQGFDRFVIRFLRSTEPLDVLEEEVEKQVIQGKNFYLYKVYRDSYCHQKELLEYLV